MEEKCGTITHEDFIKRWEEQEKQEKAERATFFGKIKWFFYDVKCWIRRTWTWFCDIPRETKWFIQRGRRGWSDRDVWCMHCHLTEIIVGMTEHLRKHGSGYGYLDMPFEIDGSVSEIQAKTRALIEPTTYPGEDKIIGDWNAMLKTIEDAHRLMLRLDDDLYHPFPGCEDRALPKGTRYLTQEEIDTIKKGRENLIKYWFHLWD